MLFEDFAKNILFIAKNILFIANTINCFLGSPLIYSMV